MARQRRSRSCSMKGRSGFLTLALTLSLACSMKGSSGTLTLTLALTLSLACSMKGSSGTAFHAAWAPLRSCLKVVG